MLKNSVKLSAALLLAFTVAACDSDDDETVVPEMITAETSAFVGEWATDCVPFGALPDSDIYAIYSVQFDATEWEYVIASFVDESCTTQMVGTEEAGRTTSTTTISGTYIDQGTETTTDGLAANRLSLTLLAGSNTLDEPGDDSGFLIGEVNDALVFVNDADVLFIDAALVGSAAASGSTLSLTLPFSMVGAGG